MTVFKDSIEQYTETEFLEFLDSYFSEVERLSGDELDEYTRKYVKHFEKITEHPDKSDVLFYPKEGQEDSSEGVLKEVKDWRAANGKPGFKPEPQ